MARFHIRPKTGDPGLCRAKPGNCPYGGEDAHYTTADEARAAFEKSSHSFSESELQETIEFVKAAEVREGDFYEGSIVKSAGRASGQVMILLEDGSTHTHGENESLAILRSGLTDEAAKERNDEAREARAESFVVEAKTAFEYAAREVADEASIFGRVESKTLSKLIEAQALNRIAEEIRSAKLINNFSYTEALDHMRDYYKASLYTHVLKTGLTRSNNAITRAVEDAEAAAILHFIAGEE